MNFFRHTLWRSSALTLLGLFVAVIGCVVFNRLPRSLFPEVNYPRVVVDVNMGFVPLQNMEWGITSVLEKELRAVPGVRVVKSTTSRGLSTIDVFLNEDQEITSAVQRVNAKIAEVRSVLPASAVITVRPITAAAFPAAEYCFTSTTKNSRDLRTFVEYTIKPLILVVNGVFDARVIGGELPELSVELDPAKMARRNLTVADIDDRLKNSNSLDFIGPVDQGDKELLAFGGKYIRNAEDIESVVFDSSLGQAVRLRDVGSVQLTNAWKTKDVDVSGTPCVGIDVFYQGGIDQKTTSGAVSETVAQLVKKNPDLARRSWDLNDFTDKSTNAVLIDLAVGMLIIAMVTLVFLGNLRSSLVALLVMPLSASFTFLAMSALGLSINLMTLGGLTAAIGLVVDNTVIILEMFEHHRRRHPERSSSSILVEVLSTVAKPMIFGTATIALVFTPIGFLSGVSRMFFAPMASVHGSSLTISVLLALFLVPGLMVWIQPRRASKAAPAVLKESRMSVGYGNFLARVLNLNCLMTCLLVALPLIGLASLPFAKTGFLPEWDEGDLVVDYRAEEPLSLGATVEHLKPLEAYLKSLPEVDFFVRKTGTALGEFDKLPYLGEIIVILKKDRKRSVFELRDAISAQAEKLVPGFEFDLFQILPDRLNDLSGTAKPIVLYLHGDSEQAMDEAAEKVKTAFTAIKGLDSVRIEEPEQAPELLYSINEAQARALDLNPSAVNANARLGLFSLDSTSVQAGPQVIPVRLHLKRDKTLGDLARLPLYTSKGGLEKIGSIGSVKEVHSRVEATHIDGTPVRTVTAEIAGRDLGSVVKDIQKSLSSLSLDGIYPELAGDYRTQQRSFRELLLAFATGLCLIFMTTLFFTNRLSIAFPLTIAATVPPVLGLVGCVAFGIPLDVSSFSGLISVTGIAVANGFMAISAIEAQPTAVSDRRTRVRLGMQSRLRPILMTNLAAMAGFVPIAAGFAQGDEILRPFSIAIIVGLFGALFTTLVIMPAFYLKFAAPPRAIEMDNAT